MSRPRTIVRTLFGLFVRVMAALLFGAILSLTIAIWAANVDRGKPRWVRTPATGALASQIQQVQITRYDYVTTMTTRWTSPVGPGQFDPSDPALHLLPNPDSRQLLEDIVTKNSGINSLTITTSGWPLNCLASHVRWVNTTGLAAGFHTWRPQWSTRPIVIPFQPLWRNLAANSALLGSPLLLILLAIPPLRRWRRTRRGLCPLCSYDLKHNLPAGCPECGWNRSPAPASPSLTPRRL